MLPTTLPISFNDLRAEFDIPNGSDMSSSNAEVQWASPGGFNLQGMLGKCGAPANTYSDLHKWDTDYGYRLLGDSIRTSIPSTGAPMPYIATFNKGYYIYNTLGDQLLFSADSTATRMIATINKKGSATAAVKLRGTTIECYAITGGILGTTQSANNRTTITHGASILSMAMEDNGLYLAVADTNANLSIYGRGSIYSSFTLRHTIDLTYTLTGMDEYGDNPQLICYSGYFYFMVRSRLERINPTSYLRQLIWQGATNYTSYLTTGVGRVAFVDRDDDYKVRILNYDGTAVESVVDTGTRVRGGATISSNGKFMAVKGFNLMIYRNRVSRGEGWVLVKTIHDFDFNWLGAGSLGNSIAFNSGSVGFIGNYLIFGAPQFGFLANGTRIPRPSNPSLSEEMGMVGKLYW